MLVRMWNKGESHALDTYKKPSLNKEIMCCVKQRNAQSVTKLTEKGHL